MIKCVVFDFDGTLVDSNGIKREVFFEIVRDQDPGGEIVAGVFERWPLADRYEKTRRIAEEMNPEELIISKETTAGLMRDFREALSKMENKVLTLYLQGEDYVHISELLGKSPKSIDNAPPESA